ncbi:DUF6082 family protein [Streptomyces sp. NPDC058045]|uniref:DUF6082 family protein n=1 Tax=Streptomyces sp. NPDC058045 TaxID=3346311 RepID=UPI0036E201AD
MSPATVAGLAALAGAAAALAAQQRLLAQRLRADAARDARNEALARQQALQSEMLGRATADPDLAAVLDTFEPAVDARTLKQYLFANALYTNTLLAWRVGIVDWEELHGHLRLICQSKVFRGYWTATGNHRASLVDTSDEARLGRMVDGIIRDLEDADSDEWWVVGNPPTD